VKKLAVFVEGLTERLFVERLIQEVAGERNVLFSRNECPVTFVTLKHCVPTTAVGPERFFVLIYNCRGDSQVKSEMLDQRPSLSKAGYDLILGLRDLYPIPVGDLAKVKAGLRYRVPTAGVPTHILLAVAEIEAWFLQESTHFARIDRRLDVSTFGAAFGFDPRTDDAESIPRPADLLHQIYQSVGKAYKKNRTGLQRTVDAIDYGAMYLDRSARIPHFADFLRHIDHFLS
jgi:hypothetical protein